MDQGEITAAGARFSPPVKSSIIVVNGKAYRITDVTETVLQVRPLPWWRRVFFYLKRWWRDRLRG